MYLRSCISMAAALLSIAPLVKAQTITVAGRNVQIHGFFSQGFLYSNQNNYLTMKTSDGSFAFTDGGLNVTSMVTEKLRVGAQVYIRNVGNLGKGHPQLDWALADYKFNDWFGLRAGQVKTVLGLYNDSQDLEFLHTWALLPQAVYPVDLRGDTIAHIGGDAYGKIRVKKGGYFAYTVYGGKMPSDMRGGYVYGLTRSSRRIDSYGGTLVGSDLRWSTPVKGLLAGASIIRQDIHADGTSIMSNTPYDADTRKNHTFAQYVEYVLGNLRLNGEYRRNLKAGTTSSVSTRTNQFAIMQSDSDSRSGYVSAAYRFTSWLEAGTYHSRFYANWSRMHGLPSNHIFDQAVTARVDFKKHWDVKVEGHFIDGYGSSSSDRGFYSADNPAGKLPNTRLLVVRLGFRY